MKPDKDNPAPPAGRRGLRAALVVVGAVITILLGSTAFVDWSFSGDKPLATARFSVGQFVSALGDNLGWLVIFFILSAAMLPLRAIQWQKTLVPSVPFMERWHFVNIGAAVHNLLPGNMGDVTRAFLLARTQRMPFVVGLGSVAVCKLLELASLIIVAAIILLFPYWSQIPQVVTALRAGAWICVGLVVLVLVLAHFSRRVATKLEARGRLPKVQRLLLEVDAGLGTARSVRGTIIALLWSFPPNLACMLGYGIGLLALGVPHGLLAGPLVLALIALGKGVPGLPTGPGVYMLVVAWAARALGASDADAAAYALLTNIATGVSHWVPGLVSLAVRRIRWSELKAQTAMAAREAKKAQEQTTRGVGRGAHAEA